MIVQPGSAGRTCEYRAPKSCVSSRRHGLPRLARQTVLVSATRRRRRRPRRRWRSQSSWVSTRSNGMTALADRSASTRARPSLRRPQPRDGGPRRWCGATGFGMGLRPGGRAVVFLVMRTARPSRAARWLHALFSRLDGAPRHPLSSPCRLWVLAGASCLGRLSGPSPLRPPGSPTGLQVLEGDDDAEARANAWTHPPSAPWLSKRMTSRGCGTAVSAGPGPRSTSGPRVVDRCVVTNLAFLAYRRGDLEEASRFSEEAVVQQRARVIRWVSPRPC